MAQNKNTFGEAFDVLKALSSTIQNTESDEALTEAENKLINYYLWGKIYEKNPGIYNKLQEAKKLYKSNRISNTNKRLKSDSRLFSYWEMANLDKTTPYKTPEEFFNAALKQEGVILHNIYERYLEKYDYTKAPWENQSRVGRNNLLFNLNYARLQDPNTMRERFTPGGFEHVKQAASDMRDILGIKDGFYDYADPYTLILYNQQNQVAGKLISIFANQNANYAMASLMDSLELKSPIAFGQHSTAGLKNLLTRNALCKELLAASVDAVKDPCLSMLNFNTITANSAAMLVRLGYSFRDIGLLFNQPIIKQLTKSCLDNGISDVNSEIERWLSAYNQDGVVNRKEDNATSGLSSEVLKNSLMEWGKGDKSLSKLSTKDRTIQVKALLLFKEILQNADELNQFVTTTKFTASNSVRPTLGGMYAQQLRVRNYLNNVGSKKARISMTLSTYTQQTSPIEDIFDITNRKDYDYMRVISNPFGYEQVMYDANKAALKALSKYFPYESMDSLRMKLLDCTIGSPNEDTINDFHKEIIRYVISRNPESLFNDNRLHVLPDGTEVGNKEYYSIYVPYRIAATLNKYPELKNNPLFALSTNHINANNEVEFKLLDSGVLTATDKENITMGWEELANLGLENLAIDIYMYNYYKSGFGFGAIGFNHLSPVSVKKNIGKGENSYLESLWRLMEYDNNSMSQKVTFREMMTEFIGNNSDNYQLVYTPTSAISSVLYDSSVAPIPLRRDSQVPSFTLDSTNAKTAPFILKKDNGVTYWKPAIKIKTRNAEYLYIAKPVSDGYININKNSNTMEYVLYKPSKTSKVKAENVETYNSDQLHEYSSSFSVEEALNPPRIVDFGMFEGTTVQELEESFNKILKVASRLSYSLSVSLNYTSVDILNANFYYGDIEIVKRDILNSMKKDIKKWADENGYRGKINNELIC